MNILYITTRFPYPALKGDQLRDLKQIELLATKHSITLVTFRTKNTTIEHIEFMKKYCNVELIEWNESHRYASLFLHTLLNKPLQVGLFLSLKMKKKIDLLIKENKYDLVHVHLARAAEYAKNIHSIPKVLDLMDAFSLNMKNRAKKEKLYKKAVFWFEQSRMEKYEKELIKTYDKVIVVSQRDKKALQTNDIRVIPLGVENCPEENAPKEIDIIFSGNMGYFPNQDGILWFVEKVFPLVLKEYPNIQLYIVGCNPNQKLKKLQNKNIIVTGRVPSMQEYLKKSHISIAPLRSGSGMQIKVMEAMAVGLPVVASIYASEGITEAVDGRDLLIVEKEDPKLYAQKVLTLIKEKGLRDAISKNARNTIRNYYSWEKSVEKLESIYQEVLKKYENRH